MPRYGQRVGAQEGGELEPQCISGPCEGEEWMARRVRATAKFRGNSCHKTTLTSDTNHKFRGSKTTLMVQRFLEGLMELTES